MSEINIGDYIIFYLVDGWISVKSVKGDNSRYCRAKVYGKEDDKLLIIPEHAWRMENKETLTLLAKSSYGTELSVGTKVRIVFSSDVQKFCGHCFADIKNEN